MVKRGANVEETHESNLVRKDPINKKHLIKEMGWFIVSTTRGDHHGPSDNIPTWHFIEDSSSIICVAAIFEHIDKGWPNNNIQVERSVEYDAIHSLGVVCICVACEWRDEAYKCCLRREQWMWWNAWRASATSFLWENSLMTWFHADSSALSTTMREREKEREYNGSAISLNQRPHLRH